ADGPHRAAAAAPGLRGHAARPVRPRRPDLAGPQGGRGALGGPRRRRHGPARPRAAEPPPGARARRQAGRTRLLAVRAALAAKSGAGLPVHGSSPATLGLLGLAKPFGVDATG